MARDLKRGLYNLTFKDNMPGEPQVYSWRPDLRSDPSAPVRATVTEQNYATYSFVGNRCFFKINGMPLNISGSPQSVFWLKLPAPAKSLTEIRNLGWMFTPYPDGIFVNGLINPSEWWLRIEALSAVAKAGTLVRADGQRLYISGDYEVHPTYLATGTLLERDVPFFSYSNSLWTSYTLTITPGAGSASAVDAGRYHVINDALFLAIQTQLTFSNITNTVAVTFPPSLLPDTQGFANIASGPTSNVQSLVTNWALGSPTFSITLPVGNYVVGSDNYMSVSFFYRVS